jgi:signal transduction histidine kinase
MASLVANLLNFSRRSRPQVSSLDIREELDNTLALMQSHLRNRRITLIREFAPEVPLLYADRQQLRQVFLNLFTNASDAMPHGGTLTLRVRADTLASGAAAVVFECADTGVGVAPENLARVGEAFFTTKGEDKGTGLGVAICRRIVQDYGGTWEIMSAVGQGTTVRVTLPMTSGAHRASRQAAGAE